VATKLPKPTAKTPPAYKGDSRSTYRYGDGDVVQPKRIGSDHSHLKSKGTLC